jgi:hypothetical protein
MPERVNSSASIIPCVSFLLVAMIAVHFLSPVRAESACIEQPSQPAPDGTHWSVHYDRAKGRKCWFLADAKGRDVTASQAQPSAVPTPAPADSLSSQIASLLGSLTGAAESALPQANASQGDAPQLRPPRGPRKPRSNGANDARADNGVQAEQKGAGEGRAVKHVSSPLTEPEREALFEEFLRWREIQQTMGGPVVRPLRAK